MFIFINLFLFTSVRLIKHQIKIDFKMTIYFNFYLKKAYQLFIKIHVNHIFKISSFFLLSASNCF